MRRMMVWTLGAVALIAMAGCSHNQAVTAASTPTATTGAPSPTARPTIAKEQAADLAKAAALDSNGATILGAGKADKVESVEVQPTGVCGIAREPRTVVAGVRTTWNLDNALAVQVVSVYQHQDAPVVLADSRRDSRNCYTQTYSNVVMDSHVEITLPTYPGAADVFGYCDRLTFTKGKSVNYSCDVLLTHANGYIVTDVSVQGLTLDGVKASATLFGSLAAERLAKIPTS